jgi:hypothetical protein
MAGQKGMYKLLALVAVVILIIVSLPTIRSMFAPIFPEGFRDVDCKGITCDEGEFCQENVCRPVMPAIRNNYFPK